VWRLRVDHIDSRHAHVTFFDWSGANLGQLVFEVHDFQSFCYTLQPASITFVDPLPAWWEYQLTDVLASSWEEPNGGQR